MGVPRNRMDRFARNMGPILGGNEGPLQSAPRTALDRLGSNRAAALIRKAAFTSCRLSPIAALQLVYSSRYGKDSENVLEGHSGLGTLCNLGSKILDKSESITPAPNSPRFTDPHRSSHLSWGSPGIEWIGSPATWAPSWGKMKDPSRVRPGQLSIGLDLIGPRH